jgi:hypothetical protein
LPWKWKETFKWFFNAGSVPSDVNKDNAEEALRDATRNIVFAHNNCGLADSVGANASYQGRTTHSTQISNDGGCGDGDDESVNGFGTLPDGVLATTCTYYNSDGEASESDTRFNKAHFKWYAVKPPSCSDRISIQGVATHERGHTFGLGHVSENGHANLTMSTAVGACDDRPNTLGLGDVKGLNAKY